MKADYSGHEETTEEVDTVVQGVNHKGWTLGGDGDKKK